MFAWIRWVWTASPGPPTFPVVLSGCQVDGQVNDDEWSPPLRHVDYPHALTYSHNSTHTHTQMNITALDGNAPTVGFWHFTCTTFIWRIIPSFTVFILPLPPPSLHPLSPPLSLFLFLSVCVFYTQARLSGLSSGNNQDLGSACPLGWTFLAATGWQLDWLTDSVTDWVTRWLDDWPDWLTEHNGIPWARTKPMLEQKTHGLLREVL